MDRNRLVSIVLSPAWRNRATEEQKRIAWEMAVRIEKVIATVLDEAHERQVEEVMDTFQEGWRACTNARLDLEAPIYPGTPGG